jgi:hypothetical protein
MGRLRFALALLGTAALSGGAGFAIGGRTGFAAGYTYASVTDQVVAGAMAKAHLVHANPEETRSLLELHVDAALIAAQTYREIFGESLNDLPFYAPADVRGLDLSKALWAVASYRRDHASTFDDPEVDELRRAAVEHYAAPPKAP